MYGPSKLYICTYISNEKVNSYNSVNRIFFPFRSPTCLLIYSISSIVGNLFACLTAYHNHLSQSLEKSLACLLASLPALPICLCITLSCLPFYKSHLSSSFTFLPVFHPSLSTCLPAYAISSYISQICVPVKRFGLSCPLSA